MWERYFDGDINQTSPYALAGWRYTPININDNIMKVAVKESQLIEMSYTKDGELKQYFGIEHEGEDIQLLHKKIEGTDERMDFAQMTEFLIKNPDWVKRVSLVDGEFGQYFAISMINVKKFTLKR